MDLSFTPEEIAFREEVRTFIHENLPSRLQRKVARGEHLDKADTLEWQKILHKRGWGAPAWPKKYGGTGWSAAQRYIFDEETAAHDCPGQLPFGISMVAPVIYTFGSDAQKAQHLPGIIGGDVWWCQGYSEPGSGSDLASLRTSAVLDGDHYVVNGHKIWTTLAHYADWIFCLVRTDPKAKQQEGISFLLIDMKTPGITVKPIITIDEGHSVNEVFLDNVRVPRENLVGQENKGWTYAKFLLGHERTGIGMVAQSKKRVKKLKEIAVAEQSNGQPLAADTTFKTKLAQIEVDLMALEMSNLRVLADAAKGKPPGAEASLLKIRGSELGQRITELAVDALGYYAMPYAGRHRSNEPQIGPEHGAGWMPGFLYGRTYTIYGGSNEIQRNVIAKMVLGL
jgi:alkylation response protein AidB-like acyl-CoA dehydrogenase